MKKMLNELRYRDANGNKLVEDGVFGTNTLPVVNLMGKSIQACRFFMMK